jgi:hypothetical protein
MLHRKLGMALFAIVLGLAACGGDDSGEDTSARPTNETTTTAPAEETTTTVAAAGNVCDRFTAEEVSEMTGVQVGDGEVGADGAQCTYFADPSGVVTVLVFPDDFGDPAAWLDTRSQIQGSFEELSGVGDAAYVSVVGSELTASAVADGSEYSVKLSMNEEELASHRDGAVALLTSLVG